MSLFGNPVLAGSAGQGGADLGDTIEQSLRFRGSQRLKRTLSSTSNRKTFTYSFWLKLTVDGVQSSDTIWQNGDTSGNNLFSFQWLPSPSWGDFFRVDNYTSGNQVNLNTSGTAFRDPSAWYHVVLAVDTTQAAQADRVVLYVNNQEITWGGGNTYPSQNFDTNVNVSGRDIAIGSTTVSSGWFNGYLASFQFIDGTALSPTDFGKYNEDGVWVPQDYTGTYGTNGFHLKFDSSGYNGSGGIGADHSGNGNDFTATGFDTAAIGVWTERLFSSTKSTIDFTSTSTAYNSATYAFDNNTSLATQTNATTDSSLIFRPAFPLTNVTQIRVWNDTADMENGYNGGNTSSATGGSWATVYSGPAITVNNIFTQSDNRAKINAIEVNGTVLVDNTDNDVDYFDTPTSNYATFNPLDPFAGGLTNANLAITTGTSRESAPGTIGTNSGKFYVELNCDQPPTNPPNRQYALYLVPASGMTNSTPSLSAGAYEVEIISGTNFKVATNNSNVVSGTLSSVPAANFKIQVLFNAGTRELYCGIDNENWLRSDGTISSTFDENEPTIVLPEPDSGVYTIGSNIYNGTGSINYGQMPFQYTPPTGFSALQTNNLAEPTIKNGKDHFDVALYTGNSSTPPTVTGLNFQPDFIWIKIYSSGSNHSLYDSIRGATKVICSSSTSDEKTDGEITPTSDGFTVGADNTIIGSTNSNGHNYVAWCWKAGGSSSSIAVGSIDGTNPTIASTVSANTDAGFSIVSYDGTGANATVGHGLTEPPECVIYKRREASINWVVYHKDLAATEYLELNSPSVTQPATNMFNSLRPTNSVLNIGTNTHINVTPAEGFIAYCWHSVEGYSKFGNYTGSSGTNNSFIYLGFTPAFLMVKCTSHSGNWVIKDTSRSPNNPSVDNLYANDVVGNQSALGIDLLSNGFKIREERTDTGYDTREYIYMAFASSPFGGENAPPATAR